MARKGKVHPIDLKEMACLSRLSADRQDHPAWDTLYRTWRRRCVGFASRWVRRCVAEEIAQEAFLKAFTASDPIDDFGPYILKIIKNLALDHLKRERRETFMDHRAPAGPEMLDMPLVDWEADDPYPGEMDAWKRLFREEDGPVREEDFVSDAPDAFPADDRRSRYARSLRQADNDELYELLCDFRSALSQEDQRIASLLYRRDWTYQEVRRRTRMPAEEVKLAGDRIRRRLRSAAVKCGGFPSEAG